MMKALNTAQVTWPALRWPNRQQARTTNQLAIGKPTEDLCTTSGWIRPIVEAVRNQGIVACERKALILGSRLRGSLINIGGGHAAARRWPAGRNIDAEYGERISDFNTEPIPVPDASYDNAVCEQVIEHLHNTSWFLSECARVLKPGGTLLLSTENLASLPNLFALLLGRAPFSTQSVCGTFVGGWKRGPVNPVCTLPGNAPAFSGCRGHVRVMTKGQLRELLKLAGFAVRSCYGFGFAHYILFHAVKE